MDDRSLKERFARRRFTALLVIMTIVLAGPPLISGFDITAGWFDLIMLLMLLVAILSLCFERSERLFALLFGIPTIVISTLGHGLSGSLGHSSIILGHLCGVVFVFGAAWLTIKRLFDAPTMTTDSLAGAACGYLFLGLGWSVAYSIIETLQPGSLAVGGSAVATPGNLPQQPYVLTYYSFVTLTTVGYGDITPVSPATRTLAWIEAITGQFYLAVIVAGLVSMLVAKQRQARGA